MVCTPPDVDRGAVSLVGGAGAGVLDGDSWQAELAAVRFSDGTVLGSFRMRRVLRAGGVFGECLGAVEGLRVQRDAALVSGRITRGWATGCTELVGTPVAFTISERWLCVSLEAFGSHPTPITLTSGGFVVG
jgi:hypothetical protein